MLALLKKNKIYYGTLLGVVGVIFSVCNDAIVKLGTEIFTKTQMLIYKPFYALVWFVIIGLIKNQRIFVFAKNKKLMFYRILFGLASMAFYIYGLSKISIAIFAACMLLYPLLISLFAYFIIGENATAKEQIGLMIALIGAVTIANPFAAKFETGIVLALLCAMFFALGMVYIKKLSMHGEDTRDIVGCYTYALIVLGLLNYFIFNNDQAFFNWDIKGHAILFISGLCYFTYTTCAVKAISMIRASRYSYIEYTDVLWAGIVDYLIWNHVLNYRELTGIGIIILANVYVVMNKDKANG